MILHSFDEISQAELFGPIACLYRVSGFDAALALANMSPFGLTAAIHTANVDRGMTFLSRIKSGVASINGATYGSEPHMPFGGEKNSGIGRFNGDWVLNEMTTVQWVSVQHEPRDYPF